MEYPGQGSNLDQLFKDRKNSSIDTRSILRDLFEGIQFLHENGICHRDIKPENVYISDSSQELKIIDFNSATKLREKEFTIGVAGDPEYQAPEMKDSRPYSTKVDIWSAGLVAYFILSGGELPEMDEDST